MATDADTASGNAASGHGSGNPSGGEAGNLANMDQLVSEAVNRALSKRLPRVQNTEDLIAKKVEEAVSRVLKASSQPAREQDGDGNSADPERVTLKALQAQVANLKRNLEESQQAAKNERNRSAVLTKLTAKLGADSPLIGPLMDSLYDVKKRFVEQSDGRLAVKFIDENGQDAFRTLDEGIEELFMTEFKGLMPQHSKTQNLPPAQVLRGMPVQQPNNGRRPDAVAGIFAEIAADLRDVDSRAAASLGNTNNK